MQKMQPEMRKRQSADRMRARHHGFTLTEIGIVLGIIGIILGAVWVAAASVNSNQRIATTTGQFMTILQGIRTLYATSQTTGLTPDGPTSDMTFNLCSANVFPSSMIPSSGCGSSASPTVSNAWNGAVTVYSTSVSTANTGDAFAIQLTGVDQNGCFGLLTSLGQTSNGTISSSGIIYLNASTGVLNYSANTSQPSKIAFPITPTEILGNACKSTTGPFYILAVFSLKG